MAWVWFRPISKDGCHDQIHTTDAGAGVEVDRELTSAVRDVPPTEGGALTSVGCVASPVVERLFGYGTWWSSGATSRATSPT